MEHLGWSLIINENNYLDIQAAIKLSFDSGNRYWELVTPKERRSYHERTLAFGLEKNLDSDHLDILLTKECRDHVKLALHLAVETKEILKRAVDGHERHLGPGHPEAQGAMRDLIAREEFLARYRPNDAYCIHPEFRLEQSGSVSQTVQAMQNLDLLPQHHYGRSSDTLRRLLNRCNGAGRPQSIPVESRSESSSLKKEEQEVEAENETETEWVNIPSTGSPSNEQGKTLESEAEAEAEAELGARAEAMGSPFDRQIRIAIAKGKHSLAMALLDPQCRAGNWISKRLVQRLGKAREISQDYTTPNLQDVNGHDVEPCGTISLEWWWHPQGIRVYECDFYVFANSDHLDVLLGAQCIFRERLLEAPKNHIAVLTEHMRQKNDETAKMTSLEEEQRRKRAALEARRQQQANGLPASSNGTVVAESPQSQQQPNGQSSRSHAR